MSESSFRSYLPSELSSVIEGLPTIDSVLPYLKDPNARKLIGKAAVVSVGAVALTGLTYYLLKGRAKSKLRESELEANIELNKYEELIANDLVREQDIGVDFDDIGGLEDQIKTIEELVIYPLSHPHLYQHSAVAQQTAGVLLYGPPGTGKTMLAKAVAKTARASFLNLNIAHIQSKWFGDTPKLVEAVFTLARKVSPCVIFIDEVDGFLSARNDSDQQHVNTMKTKFMEMWDGLTTPKVNESDSKDPTKNWVIIIGATNKPWALDPAVLRRMPRQIVVNIPDLKGRAAILRVLLRKERISDSVDFLSIAEATEGYSGSDLKEVVRVAAMIPIRESIELHKKYNNLGKDRGEQKSQSAEVPVPIARPIENDDLILALQAIKPTGVAAMQYKFVQAAAANGFQIRNGSQSFNRNNVPDSFENHNGKSPRKNRIDNTIGNAPIAPDYIPSHSLRLNSKALASAVESDVKNNVNSGKNPSSSHSSASSESVD